MTRALVLSGGGPVGIAWEAGLIAGLAEGGADVSNADYILGTSAGSFVGALLAMGRTPAEIAAPDLEGNIPLPPVNQPPPDLAPLVAKMIEAAKGERPPQQVRSEIGAWALSAYVIPEEQSLARFSNWLGEPREWPSKAYACTAVDAADGSFLVWNKDSGIDLARAVASSCAVPGLSQPVSFGGRRYIDGGMRSGTNADLAKGYDRVLVIAVALRAGFLNESIRRRFEGELQSLRDGGSQVEVIAADEESAAAFGANLMDATRRQGSALAGFDQGKREAARIAAFWS